MTRSAIMEDGCARARIRSVEQAYGVSSNDPELANEGGEIISYKEKHEEYLENKKTKLIAEIKSRFNKISSNAREKKEVFLELAKELGFEDLVGEAAVRASAREKKRDQRVRMTPEELADYRAKRADTTRERRARMAPEQADAERAYTREKMREHRARMTPEEAGEKRAKETARRRAKRHGMPFHVVR